MHLLEYQSPHDGIEFFGWSPESFSIMGSKLVNRQIGKNMFPKETCPGSIQKLASFRAQILPGIDQVGRFVIANMNHEISTYVIDI
jgi:hypothetical protein